MTYNKRILPTKLNQGRSKMKKIINNIFMLCFCVAAMFSIGLAVVTAIGWHQDLLANQVWNRNHGVVTHCWKGDEGMVCSRFIRTTSDAR